MTKIVDWEIEPNPEYEEGFSLVTKLLELMRDNSQHKVNARDAGTYRACVKALDGLQLPEENYHSDMVALPDVEQEMEMADMKKMELVKVMHERHWRYDRPNCDSACDLRRVKAIRRSMAYCTGPEHQDVKEYLQWKIDLCLVRAEYKLKGEF